MKQKVHMESNKMRNKIIGLIGMLILATGIILFVKSKFYERYTNEQAYETEYWELSGDENRSEKFYELRKNYLTPKFKLEDYGITFIMVGVASLLIPLIGIQKLKTPNKKVWILLIGVFAALIANIGYVGDLLLEMHRGSYPHWADSLSIPLMSVPVLLILAFVWMILNLIGIRGGFKTNVVIFPFKINKLNYWYRTILILTIILTGIMVTGGYFWQVLSGILWAYFYLSIGLGRTAPINPDNQNVRTLELPEN